jgi:hypothetical protein
VVLANACSSDGGGSAGSAGTGGPGGAAGIGGAAGAAGVGGNGGSVARGGTGGPPPVTGFAGIGGSVPALGPGGAPVACQEPIAVTTGTAATVTVNLDMVGRVVSPDLMGIHTSVYDGSMQLPTTPDLLRTAGIKSVRYPGGSYADLYHWESHTGTWTPAAGAGGNGIYIAGNTDFGSFVGFLERIGAGAVITVNYGMNPQGTGPGVPQEAAAWVAYANGDPTSTVAIGVDDTGRDWKTVGWWASLRAGGKMSTDDGNNFLRISHPAPINIKYWEVGNETYGNGYYYGACGWEADLRVPYPPNMGTNCEGRKNNPALGPATYGAAVKQYAAVMKAVDPTIKVGAVVVGNNEYPDWNAKVLAAACPSFDFAILHWYGGNAGTGLTTAPAAPEREIPEIFSYLRSGLETAMFGCPAAMPIMVTEWGPNTLSGNDLPVSAPDAAPVGSQYAGLFAAESYANFMEQGTLAVHWLELHNRSFLAQIDWTNDPFTRYNDTRRWGYKGMHVAHLLAAGNDTMVQATVSGTFGTALKAHASRHADGAVGVMMTNTNRNFAANVTVNVTGGAGAALGCVGARYAYTPINTDQDGDLTYEPIFAASDGASVPVAVPPLSSVVVVFPKK